MIQQNNKYTEKKRYTEQLTYIQNKYGLIEL